MAKKEVVMLTQPKKEALDAMFDVHAKQIKDFRQQEIAANEARVNVEGLLIEEYFGTKESGSLTKSSDEWTVKAEYNREPKVLDMVQFSDDVGHELFKQITKVETTFSVSKAAAAIKQLEQEALTSKVAKEKLQKLKDAIEKHVKYEQKKTGLRVLKKGEKED